MAQADAPGQPRLDDRPAAPLRLTRQGGQRGRAAAGGMRPEVIGVRRHRLEFRGDRGSVVERCSDAPQTRYERGMVFEDVQRVVLAR
jgi:hypothetical protein